MGAEFCQRLFLHCWHYHVVLSFNFLIWYIILIDLHILKNPCIPGIYPIWSWCMSFLMCCWTLLKFCWRFLHLFSSVILACNFLFFWCLCLVLVSGWWWFHRKSLAVFLPLQFFEIVLEGYALALLYMFDTILPWSHLVLGFCVLGGFFFITASISMLVLGLLIISISSWFTLGRLNLSKNLSISSRLSILLPYSYS